MEIFVNFFRAKKTEKYTISGCKNQGIFLVNGLFGPIDFCWLNKRSGFFEKKGDKIKYKLFNQKKIPIMFHFPH